MVVRLCGLVKSDGNPMNKAPNWYDRTCGHDVDAWKEARRRCREILIEWVRSDHVGGYSELANGMGAIDLPDGAYTHRGVRG